jgi:hypothetical protein
MDASMDIKHEERGYIGKLKVVVAWWLWVGFTNMAIKYFIIGLLATVCSGRVCYNTPSLPAIRSWSVLAALVGGTFAMKRRMHVKAQLRELERLTTVKTEYINAKL